MGSLISEMTGSEIVATLEVLSQHGVTAEDLRFIRKYPKTYATEALRGLSGSRQAYMEATTTEPDAWAIAISAVERIEDVDMLKHIYEISPLPEVWMKIMKTLADEPALFYLIFHYYRNPKRAESCKAGLINLSERITEDGLWVLGKYPCLPDKEFSSLLEWTKQVEREG